MYICLNSVKITKLKINLILKGFNYKHVSKQLRILLPRSADTTLPYQYCHALPSWLAVAENYSLVPFRVLASLLHTDGKKLSSFFSRVKSAIIARK
jgi:hypothetical protein